LFVYGHGESEKMSQEVPTEHLQLQYIRAALSDIMAPPKDKKITKLVGTQNPDGTIATIKTYQDTELLFTLTFTWTADGWIITRT
jgi:hypothetical protein